MIPVSGLFAYTNIHIPQYTSHFQLITHWNIVYLAFICLPFLCTAQCKLTRPIKIFKLNVDRKRRDSGIRQGKVGLSV